MLCSIAIGAPNGEQNSLGVGEAKVTRTEEQSGLQALDWSVRTSVQERAELRHVADALFRNAKDRNLYLLTVSISVLVNRSTVLLQ